MKGMAADGQEQIFSSENGKFIETTRHGGQWKFDNGLEVRLQCEDGGWHFSFECCPSDLEICEIHFPVWQLEAPNLRLLLPESMGYLTGKVEKWKDGAEFFRSFYSFQMISCLGENENLLAMFPDEEYYCKNVKVWKKDGKSEASVIFYVPQQEKNCKSYTMPYPVILEKFTGGWFEAAERYRQWAKNSAVFQRAKNKVNPLRKTAMWFWNRGESAEVVPPVIRFAEQSGLPIALDWYWWHHNPYDTDYPFYWPPREGEEKFKTGVTELKGNGVFTQVYMNGLTWDMDNASWKNGGEQSSIVKRNGEIMNIAFNCYNHHRLAYMCGEAEPFQKTIISQAAKIHQAGLDGLYLDQIGCVSNFIPCWSPFHRHSRGGGNYHHQGYAAYLEKVKENCPGLSLSTEDCTEEYLDIFDSMIVLCNSIERTTTYWTEFFHGDFVPVFQAIYHGLAALFGTYAVPDSIPPWDNRWPNEDRWPEKDEEEWEKLYPDQFYLEVARNVVCGMQPTVHCLKMNHWTNPRFKEIMKYLLTTARFYFDHLEWLFDGEMMNPGTLKVSEIPVKFMTRSIYTKKEDFKSWERIFPAILHSVWRSPDGKSVLILGNYTQEEQSFEFKRIHGSMPPRSWRCIPIDKENCFSSQNIEKI